MLLLGDFGLLRSLYRIVVFLALKSHGHATRISLLRAQLNLGKLYRHRGLSIYDDEVLRLEYVLEGYHPEQSFSIVARTPHDPSSLFFFFFFLGAEREGGIAKKEGHELASTRF